MMKERYELALGRIRELVGEQAAGRKYQPYFEKCAQFILLMDETYRFIESGALREAGTEELERRNLALYEDILPEHYEESYGNPAYAKRMAGAFGSCFSFVYTKLREMIEYAYEQKIFGMVIRMELFLEVYQAFVSASGEEGQEPQVKEIEQIIYWFMSDYSEVFAQEQAERIVNPDKEFTLGIVMDSDLSDLRYLYRYGEYVTDNELKTARYLLEQPEERIKLMADTFTEGFRIGFEVTNKDISKKDTVSVYYPLGFERVVRQAVKNFEKIGLKANLNRCTSPVDRNGFYGAVPNKQYEFDHKEDSALYLDKQYTARRLDAQRSAFEKRKELAAVFGGPAVIEVFGEEPFAPVTKPEACSYSKEQRKISVEFASAAGDIMNEYIKGEERSFTCIAFPVPDIGEQYEEIFDEIIRINTLDYQLYRGIQQKIIDRLDLGDRVVIKGMNGNRTDLTVRLHTLEHPDKESNFENCVADVNIPVGEVFTSPVLEGTNGVLHVSKVFMRGYEYRDLEITFKDGMVSEYRCANFESEEENKKYIEDTVLFHHESLPMGEFAIGTNTTAYVTARKYGIFDKLPVLISEKTGPHFAVGDTCYSHSEDVAVFNPDGKELIARDNEKSLFRKTDRSKAYFNCHTDITIPYDELGELTAVTPHGEELPIIKGGHFVVPGCEELNRAFEA